MSDQSERISDLIVINCYLLTLLEGEIYFLGTMHLGFCLDISLKPTYERTCLMKVSHIWKYVSNILEKACTRDLHYFPCLHIWKLRSLQRQQWKITIKNWISTGTDIATTFKKCDDNLQCVLLICWQPLLIRFKCLLRWFVVFTIGEALSSQFSGKPTFQTDDNILYRFFQSLWRSQFPWSSF